MKKRFLKQSSFGFTAIALTGIMMLVLVSCPGADTLPQTFSITRGTHTGGNFIATHANAAAGTQINLTVSPNTGFSFVGWNIAGAAVDPIRTDNSNVWSFSMPAAHIVVNAAFGGTITKGTHVNGTFTVSHEAAEAGAAITLTATPNAGYDFYAWNITGGIEPVPHEEYPNTWTFEMPPNAITVNAVFNVTWVGPPVFTITQGVSENGSFTASPLAANRGETITLTATPNAGFVFSAWNITGATVALDRVGDTGVWTFPMPAADITVNALFNVIQQPPVNPGELGPVALISAQGWRETFYVTWYKLDGAASYNVYFRGGAAGDWTRIDDPLIREYEGGFFRADVLGIRAGNYEAKVVPVNSAGEVSPNAAIWPGLIPVTAHVRTGFAFAGANHPGAYNMDGTPRANARIIYVTNENKNTITLSVQDDPDRWEDAVGLQSILNRFARGFEQRPLIVRFVGKITQEDFTLQQNTLRMLQLDGTGRDDRFNAPITFEGVGNDAVAHGWGIRLNRPVNVEIRNLGFMLGRHNADSIDIERSRYVWVHHNDFFYNLQGGGDHHKGDGAVDITVSSHVTVSFNHFWDTGKTSLLGNASGEPTGYVTYHHNHFDHSDGRHPRVRVHQVHVFNNFYDHVATHGIGATMRSSIFAESNYFLHTRNPMLISSQGTAPAAISTEPGGMIKAYGNFMCGWTLQHFRPWSADNTSFDAFVVTNRADSVPGTVTALAGGSAFSNFDQSLPYDHTAYLLSPQEARAKVERYAGRFWGGDISFTFPASDATLNRNHRNPQLDALLFGYRSRVVAIQGQGDTDGNGNGNGNGNNGGSGTEPPPVVGGRQDFNFSAEPFVTDLTNFPATVGGLRFGSGFNFYSVNNVSIDGIPFTRALRPGGRASATQRYLIIPLEGPARITLFASSNNSNATFVNIHDGLGGQTIGRVDLPGWVSGGANINQPAPFSSNIPGSHEVALKAESNIRIFMIRVDALD